MPPLVPDILLLAAGWQPRALIRAQLIEQGFDVIATDTWPPMRTHLRARATPRLAIVDLKDLPNPEQVLEGLRVLIKPDSVIVLSAMGAVPAPALERLGFRVIPRPFAIEDVVRAAAAIVFRSP